VARFLRGERRTGLDRELGERVRARRGASPEEPVLVEEGLRLIEGAGRLVDGLPR
jgi:hypothetical protein